LFHLLCIREGGLRRCWGMAMSCLICEACGSSCCDEDCVSRNRFCFYFNAQACACPQPLPFRKVWCDVQRTRSGGARATAARLHLSPYEQVQVQISKVPDVCKAFLPSNVEDAVLSHPERSLLLQKDHEMPICNDTNLQARSSMGAIHVPWSTDVYSILQP
jgi:hypothetical protein